jgi:hypothetical protein
VPVKVLLRANVQKNVKKIVRHYVSLHHRDVMLVVKVTVRRIHKVAEVVEIVVQVNHIVLDLEKKAV